MIGAIFAGIQAGEILADGIMAAGHKIAVGLKPYFNEWTTDEESHTERGDLKLGGGLGTPGLDTWEQMF